MMHNIEEGYVSTHNHNNISHIEFYHPQSNSLPSKILHELAIQITTAGADNDAAVIVLQSKGEKVFCSGASFDELSNITTEEAGKKFFSGFAHVINAIRKCPKFIIGRIQGKCVGGGVGLAAAVDYAIATNQSDVKLSELAVGIGPFVVGPAIERKVGISAFTQLAIDASMWRNADWAKRKGLFAETHESIENMDESIERLAATLSKSSREAMKEMKKIMWKGCEHWDELLLERAAVSGKLVLTKPSKTAIAQFKQKMARN
jgi:methylglutaconyl-CoA hydratase